MMIEVNRLAGRSTVSTERDGLRAALAKVDDSLSALEKEIGVNSV
jgi:hypothetical protein